MRSARFVRAGFPRARLKFIVPVGRWEVVRLCYSKSVWWAEMPCSTRHLACTPSGESCALYLTVMARDCAGCQDKDKSRQRGSGLLVNIFRTCEGSDLDGLDGSN